ncbi:MAG: hypothetical protein Q8M76_07340, partial [Spirochaetaceae bacterium]|nr:hypothetical protein [Spirochaetaceae bacterium]
MRMGVALSVSSGVKITCDRATPKRRVTPVMFCSLVNSEKSGGAESDFIHSGRSFVGADSQPIFN